MTEQVQQIKKDILLKIPVDDVANIVLTYVTISNTIILPMPPYVRVVPRIPWYEKLDWSKIYYYWCTINGVLVALSFFAMVVTVVWGRSCAFNHQVAILQNDNTYVNTNYQLANYTILNLYNV